MTSVCLRLRNKSQHLKIQTRDLKDYLVLSLFYEHPCERFSQDEFVRTQQVYMDPHTAAVLAGHTVQLDYIEGKLCFVCILSTVDDRDDTIERAVNAMLHMRSVSPAAQTHSHTSTPPRTPPGTLAVLDRAAQ